MVSKMQHFMQHICNMLKHRGEILKKVFDELNLKVATVARKVGIDRGTVYRHFDERDLSIDYIVKYGKAMNYDFSKYFPEILNITREPIEEYKKDKLSYAELEAEMFKWKDKYIELLEKYNELLLENK